MVSFKKLTSPIMVPPTEIAVLLKSYPTPPPTEIEPTEPVVEIAPVISLLEPSNVMLPSMLPDETIFPVMVPPTLIAVSPAIYPTLPLISIGALTLLVTDIPTPSNPETEPTETEPTEPVVEMAPSITVETIFPVRPSFN